MSPNQRQFHRCPLSAEQPAVLIVDQKKIAGRLVDISLGGFGVMVSQSLPVIREPLARLMFRELEYVVRVARQESRNGGVMLALEQVEEIVPNDTTSSGAEPGPWMIFAAWTAAICVVIAAVCFISGTHFAGPLSLNR